jgi:anti-anti-sigma factor
MNNPSQNSSNFLTISIQNDVAIATFLLTRLSEEQNIEELSQEIDQFVDTHDLTKLVVVMDKVDFVSSSGVGKLIMLNRRLHRAQGTMVLCGITERVYEVLLTSSLLNYFTTTDTLPAALTLLNAPAKS